MNQSTLLCPWRRAELILFKRASRNGTVFLSTLRKTGKEKFGAARFSINPVAGFDVKVSEMAVFCRTREFSTS